MDLTAAEVRVLGCLIEKEATTPDNYPLTVNSLMLACNQTTNRCPVVRYGEGEVTVALTSLRERGLTRIVYSPSNRAPKHRHVADERLRLAPEEMAVVGVLALRGPQTVGEIKGRTERIHPFADLAETEAVLERLAARDEPLVVVLPRRPGQKDVRWAHLLAGPPDEAAFEDADAGAAGSASGRLDRVAELTARVDALELQLGELQTRFDELRALLD
jgi:uncharacterized protein YceH (UPF0502 family)